MLYKILYVDEVSKKRKTRKRDSINMCYSHAESKNALATKEDKEIFKTLFLCHPVISWFDLTTNVNRVIIYDNVTCFIVVFVNVNALVVVVFGSRHHRTVYSCYCLLRVWVKVAYVKTSAATTTTSCNNKNNTQQ